MLVRSSWAGCYFVDVDAVIGSTVVVVVVPPSPSVLLGVRCRCGANNVLRAKFELEPEVEIERG